MKPTLLLLWFCLLPSITRAQLTDENLLEKQPRGYKVGYQVTKGHMTMVESVPEGESVENWTEMVTTQIFHGMKASLEEFQYSLKRQWMAACVNGTVTAAVTGKENGYPVAFWVMRCPLNPSTGKPEDTFFKAIKGNDALYVIQKAFKFVPSQEQTEHWVRYLREVQVCDQRIPDRTCSASEVWKSQ